MTAKKSVRASAHDPDSDALAISADHPLVCNRRSEVLPVGFSDLELPIHRQYTLAQRWLASRGFHPGW